MAVRVSMVILVSGLCLMTVKYWNLKGKQDSCLVGLDKHLKLVKKSEAELGDSEDKLESLRTQNDFEIAALKKLKNSGESKLRMCEKSTADLVKDIEGKEGKIEDSEAEMEKVRKDLDEMVAKFTTMKTEYERALSSEKSLIKERDDLKESLSISQKKRHENLQKAQDLGALNDDNLLRIKKLEEQNYENLSKMQDLEEALQEKKDMLDKKVVEPKADKDFYQGKLSIKDKDEVPKRDILDQKVEEAFAKAAVAPPPKAVDEMKQKDRRALEEKEKGDVGITGLGEEGKKKDKENIEETEKDNNDNEENEDVDDNMDNALEENSEDDTVMDKGEPKVELNKDNINLL